MYDHQDLEFFYLGSEEEWTMEKVTPHRAKGNVLILEDFDAIRALLAEQFKRQGYDVDSSATLHGALALAHDREPNVLYVDYNLSSENPFNAIQQLRLALPNTTIVLIAGPLSANDQERAFNSGASRIMQKDYNLAGMGQIEPMPTTALTYLVANV
jgi:CheY-like chemotaxis protein